MYHNLLCKNYFQKLKTQAERFDNIKNINIKI